MEKFTNKMTVQDIDVTGKRVLVRVDYNVPLDETGQVRDNWRITASLPTLKYLLSKNAKIILLSHLGRPKGSVNPAMSLRPVQAELARLLDHPVDFADDCIGPKAQKAVGLMRNGDILLLENLRFYAQEEANDLGFARDLAALGDIYVDDAFGTAHRAHASTEGITHYLPSVAGFLLEEEINCLSREPADPQRPYVAILSGAKASDKIRLIENLLTHADKIMLGGGLANTFLLAQGYDVKNSLVDLERVDLARELMARPEGAKIVLPVDVIAAEAVRAGADHKTVDLEDIPPGWGTVDIGPKTIDIYSQAVMTAGTVLWNGPLGVYEIPEFSKGTALVGRAVAQSRAFSILGGGDLAAAVRRDGLTDKINHICTGGGAMLAYLKGKPLRAVEALTDKVAAFPLDPSLDIEAQMQEGTFF
ncbi:MAG: phosphoglycerate kinase [Clostridiales bacterium]|jgi:phosphoglycerate kinase|nr:phosphoglycerate kinase [Clostridiales bacterium]